MKRVFSILTIESYSHGRKQSDMCVVMYKNLPLKCLGQHTNSTPLNKEMPQGRSMAKDRNWSPLSWQALPAVAFHRPNVQQLLWLWMWSNKQFSGTKRASDWNGPSENKQIYYFKIYLSINREIYNSNHKTIYFRSKIILKKKQ